jgi:hypothetical protein
MDVRVSCSVVIRSHLGPGVRARPAVLGTPSRNRLHNRHPNPGADNDDCDEPVLYLKVGPRNAGLGRIGDVHTWRTWR